MKNKLRLKALPRRWQTLAGLLLAVCGLFLLLGQPLAQAWNGRIDPEPERGQRDSSVRSDFSDMELFGKRLTTFATIPDQERSALQVGSGPVVPTRIRIPALGIDTAVESVGMRRNRVDVPGNIWDTGWFRDGVRPGAVGNAVIDGHKDSIYGNAIFGHLGDLKAGDRVYVSDEWGWELTFEVTGLESYTSETAPLDRIFGPSEGKNLNLITCDGTFLPEQRTYDKRLVVFTRLVETL